MRIDRILKAAAVLATALMASGASASLTPVEIFNGRVGVSIDGLGSNNSPVGNIQADIPAGSTILRAYLYSAGTPYPWYPDSPRTLADYNGAGITLGGNAITNFSALVGATSTRVDIGQWYTARADVTSVVTSLVGAGSGLFDWSVSEGTRNTRIDGEVLVIVYSNPALPEGSVALLDGGQNTGGETTVVSLGAPLTDPNAAGFVATMSIADTFSCCSQQSTIRVNGSLLSQFAGNHDDGQASDGALITVGGIGDSIANLNNNYAADDELYDLRPFLATGDTGFTLFTQNATNDDNIFFMALQLTGDIRGINQTPEPGSLLLLAVAALGLALASRRRRPRPLA